MEQLLTLQRETKEINLTLYLELGKALFKTITKVGLIGIVCYNIFLANQELNNNRITPMKIESTESKELKRTKEALAILKLPTEKIEKYAESSIMASKVAGVDPVLLMCLYWTESRFSLSAKSSMGYKSIAQTPSATGFVEADMMHGANILQTKMKIAKGDIHKALCFYKGSKFNKNTVGYKQAQEVLTVYNDINKKINQKLSSTKA